MSLEKNTSEIVLPCPTSLYIFNIPNVRLNQDVQKMWEFFPCYGFHEAQLIIAYKYLDLLDM